MYADTSFAFVSMIGKPVIRAATHLIGQGAQRSRSRECKKTTSPGTPRATWWAAQQEGRLHGKPRPASDRSSKTMRTAWPLYIQC